MTTPEQFADNGIALVAIVTLFMAAVGVLAWFLERHASKRREPEVLPPPDIPSYRNVTSIEEWRRKYDRIDLDQVDKNHGATR